MNLLKVKCKHCGKNLGQHTKDELRQGKVRCNCKEPLIAIKCKECGAFIGSVLDGDGHAIIRCDKCARFEIYN